MAREKREFDVMERLKRMVEVYEARTGRSFWDDLRDELRRSGVRSFYAGFFDELLEEKGGDEK